MRFVMVNGRTPNPQTFCLLCCEPIAGSYLREINTRLPFCDHTCYAIYLKGALTVLLEKPRKKVTNRETCATPN
jgi:hypothetical protein